jgi:hypothetical protein
MDELRSAGAAGTRLQLDLFGPAPGVGARQGEEAAQPGGGGYLDGCTPSEVGQRGLKKIAKNFSQNPALDPREAALLDELDAMGLSRVMLQIAHTIGFDNFMAMWRILDTSYEAIAENDSGIYIRLQRLSAYRRYQRNRFIEAMAAMGMSQQEISQSVKRDLGEKVSDRHIFRLMAVGRVKVRP